ncbi:deoxyribodipyrimidine photo-lyase [Prodigiosinella confusarubida]|uniref:Deoxyribodipyrimidine photo-lyase n=1 Tax=Serratia sp. (strain ATCC 39006) TaxID=104623 RepID=A0A2I5TMU7_SERS3|nr:deoxyribodipyrimidine photo-lyase [Serratia sp. ATCC 39006]AUH01558.1 deoxyribodipyrimidine photo-lyase [Serratia sp. ATCC 39006]AUH05881.1 deoxyribodipyrimidine photo-lyase [Serratia sp. ATCC 39006]
MTTHLVWLRNDLRLTDNLALHAACQDPTANVIALFIATPAQWARHDMSPRQAAFLLKNLHVLQRSLHDIGIELHYHQCADFTDSVRWLTEYCRQQRVTHLFYNYQYELNERQRDLSLEQELAGQVICQGFDDSVLLPPGSVMTGDGEMYKVFTPFREAFIKRLLHSDIHCVPAPVPRTMAITLPLRPLTPFSYPLQTINDAYPAGEKSALQRLRDFCHEQIQFYHQQRDFPAQAATSKLSPYLALGVLSPRQCINRMRIEQPDWLQQREGGAFVWFNELIWREFYRHVLAFNPSVCKRQPYIDWTQRIAWRQDPHGLAAWQRGDTGYPIVDAGMRQLNQTGWMHNRLRMICASFLVKDLLIDWREGEHYFMMQLLDGDLAANNGGWQWAASTGMDAAPYFRIFNPTVQGERFDPEGTFIRHWVPELALVPGKSIHQPHRWAESQRHQLNYPQPIVEHKQARLRALAAFKAAKDVNPGGDK